VSILTSNPVHSRNVAPDFCSNCVS